MLRSTLKNTDELSEAGANDNVYGPMLPPQLILANAESSQAVLGTCEKRQISGPALPPHLLNSSCESLKQKIVEQNYEQQKIDNETNAIIGPLPMNIEPTTSHLALEERALEIKLSKLDGTGNKNETIKKREEWMLELPSITPVGSIAVTNRKFQTKDRPDFSDRSSWTDTPQDKIKNQETSSVDKIKNCKDHAQLLSIKQYDLHQEELASKHKKHHKRDKSLVEIHRKKLKKEKKKKLEKEERRPFSREADLQINRFDSSKTKSVIKQAQLLNSKFATGSTKYL